VVHTDPADLAAALGTRIDAESDTDILTAALSVLAQTVPHDLADPVLAAAPHERTAGPSITDLVTHNDDAPQHYLRNTWVTAHLNCALHASTPHASATVNAWFSDPAPPDRYSLQQSPRFAPHSVSAPRPRSEQKHSI